MNSIKRITSAEPTIAAVATFAIAALAILVLGVTETMASAASAKSAALLQAAEAKSRGVERDNLLAAAHEAAVDAMGLAPRDAQLVAQDARILYLQATTAAVEDASIPLLDAADAAAQRTLVASRNDAGAEALRALIELARLEAPSASAAAAVSRSYAGQAQTSEVALWRGEAAAGAWSLLKPAERIGAIYEICALQRSAPFRARALAVADQIRTAMARPDAADPCTLPFAEIAAWAPPPAAESVQAEPQKQKKLSKSSKKRRQR